MRIRALTRMVITVALLLSAQSPAQAGLNAEIDLSNPRIVPMYNSDSQIGIRKGDQASYSGFLYSSRIIFSAAHSEYTFDENGNKVFSKSPYLFAGRPNTKAGDYTGAVRVIQRYVAKNYRSQNGILDDFAVYVLEKDLITAQPVSLLTKDLELELINSGTPVMIHGYGEYLDRCNSGEKLPCSPKHQKTFFPRSLTATLSTLAQAEKFVGYERPQLANHLTIINGKTGFGCGGDSGGSITATYNGIFTYLGTTPNGMNGYACGASTYYDGIGGIQYSSPVYKHLDIIQEAENFVAEAVLREEALKKLEKKITCQKNKQPKKRMVVNGTKCPSGYRKLTA